eukprot:193791-Rhodomonas_salina.1
MSRRRTDRSSTARAGRCTFHARTACSSPLGPASKFLPHTRRTLRIPIGKRCQPYSQSTRWLRLERRCRLDRDRTKSCRSRQRSCQPDRQDTRLLDRVPELLYRPRRANMRNAEGSRRAQIGAFLYVRRARRARLFVVGAQYTDGCASRILVEIQGTDRTRGRPRCVTVRTCSAKCALAAPGRAGETSDRAVETICERVHTALPRGTECAIPCHSSRY